MKLLTVTIPAYGPGSYDGATPQPYKQRAVDKLEQALLKLSDAVYRSRNVAERIVYGKGGFLEHVLQTQYVIEVEDDGGAADIALLFNEHLGIAVDKIRITEG